MIPPPLPSPLLPRLHSAFQFIADICTQFIQTYVTHIHAAEGMVWAGHLVTLPLKGTASPPPNPQKNTQYHWHYFNSRTP